VHAKKTSEISEGRLSIRLTPRIEELVIVRKNSPSGTKILLSSEVSLRVCGLTNAETSQIMINGTRII